MSTVIPTKPAAFHGSTPACCIPVPAVCQSPGGVTPAREARAAAFRNACQTRATGPSAHSIVVVARAPNQRGKQPVLIGTGGAQSSQRENWLVGVRGFEPPAPASRTQC